MRLRTLVVLLPLLTVWGTAAFAGTSSISITAPQVTGISSPGGFTPSDIASLNSALSTLFGTIENDLNTKYFNHLHDLGELSQGFANANTVACGNPSTMGFENYDLFSFFVGASLGVALPALSASGLNNLGSNIVTGGDLYGGLGTGGIAGQLGINASSFLMRSLYLSVKFGYFNLPGGRLPGGMSGDIQQMLLGVGVNYKIVSPWGLWGGLVKWRGLSLGAGLEYSRTSLNVGIDLKPETFQDSVSTSQGAVSVTATVNNPQAKLGVVASSLVVPVEAVTSIQLLWVFNLGVGVGADINLPFSSISIDGNGTTSIGLPPNFTYAEKPGSIAVTATDSTNTPGFWDYVSPRLSVDLGFNILIVRVDIPFTFYPLTRAFSIGVVGGVSW